MTRVLLLCSGPASAADCVVIGITNQPQSQTILAGCPATFAVGITGTGACFYQWRRNGQIIPGATNSSYTTARAQYADDNAAKFGVTSNNCSQATSDEAVLYLALDVVPPALRRARGDATLEQVLVSFSVGACGWPGLDPDTSQEPLNYSLTGGLSISKALC